MSSEQDETTARVMLTWGCRTRCEEWTALRLPADENITPHTWVPRADSSVRASARRGITTAIAYSAMSVALGTLLFGVCAWLNRAAGAPGIGTAIVPLAHASTTSEKPAADFLIFFNLPPAPESRPKMLDELAGKAEQLEARIKSYLAQKGFPNIGVSAAYSHEVFLAGTLFDESEKAEILRIVRKVPGVGRIHFNDTEIRKLYGPAYLGADTSPTANGRGVKVTKVWEGSPAEMAGIQKGDLITRFGEQEVSDPQAFRYMVMSRVGGQRVEVAIERAGVEETVVVRLGKLTALAFR